MIEYEDAIELAAERIRANREFLSNNPNWPGSYTGKPCPDPDLLCLGFIKRAYRNSDYRPVYVNPENKTMLSVENFYNARQRYLHDLKTFTEPFTNEYTGEK